MAEHQTREQRVLYDHESPEAPRRRPADDWGIDEDVAAFVAKAVGKSGQAAGK